jgi:transcriptional regulator with PAS, ATPase and Fis domain
VKVICSYCRKKIGEKEPINDDSVSHGMCQECYDYYKEQVNGLPLDKFLDRFEVPLLVVDKNVRIVATNKMFENLTGRSHRDVFGLLGGEVMECVYARLPEGCGRTAHCLACSIRNTVMATMESEEPQMQVPVKLRRESKEIEMVISAEKIGSFVRIIIEKAD